MRAATASASADPHFDPEVSKQPFVIMAHGFGAERTWKLPDFAARFAAAGIGVLNFDYRNFGDSPGARQWVSPSRHREDFHAALRFLRNQPGGRRCAHRPVGCLAIR